MFTLVMVPTFDYVIPGGHEHGLHTLMGNTKLLKSHQQESGSLGCQCTIYWDPIRRVKTESALPSKSRDNNLPPGCAYLAKN